MPFNFLSDLEIFVGLPVLFLSADSLSGPADAEFELLCLSNCMMQNDKNYS